MDKNLVSVIVPVYNVEKYIRECIDSILDQTFESFELILIDDGSTDTSGEICDEYLKRDSRIKVFHCENAGPSLARNKGLGVAKGDFFCFVDSDDTISRDFLEKLYDRIITDESDIVVCDIEAPKLTEANILPKAPKVMNAGECRTWLYDDRTREYVLMVSPCNKLYCADVFNDIRFPVGKRHEDEFIIGAILKKCRIVSFLPDKLYIYRNNTSGFTSDSNKLNISHLDYIDALSERIEMALKEEYREFALATLKNALYKCARLYKSTKESRYEEMKDASMLKYKEVYKNYKSLLNFKQKSKYVFFIIAPEIFIWIYNP